MPDDFQKLSFPAIMLKLKMSKISVGFRKRKFNCYIDVT